MPKMLTNDPRVFPLTLPDGDGETIVIEGSIGEAVEVVEVLEAVEAVEVVEAIEAAEVVEAVEVPELVDTPEDDAITEAIKC